MAVSVKTSFRSVAALAMVLALSVPALASAQEEHGRGDWGDRAAGNRGGWEGHRGPAQQPQQQQQQQRTWSPPQVQQQAPPPQSDGSRRGWGGGGWQGRAQQQAPQQAPVVPQGDSGGWRGRAQQQAPAVQQGDWGGRRGGGWRDGGQDARQADSGNEGWRSRRESAQRQDGGGWRGGVPAQGQRPDQAGQRPGGWQGRNPGYVDPNRNETYRDATRDGRREDHNDGDRWRDGRRDQRGGVWSSDGRRYGANDRGWRNRDDHHRDDRGWRDGDRRGYGHSGYNNWNRDWRRDRRYDWQGYRNQNRSYFQIGAYYSPYRNYSYQRFGIGFFLDSLFYSNRYWIDDPRQYRLPDVYGPYRWVRYYDDVMLVDVYTGEVVDVIYDFFW